MLMTTRALLAGLLLAILLVACGGSEATPFPDHEHEPTSEACPERDEPGLRCAQLKSGECYCEHWEQEIAGELTSASHGNPLGPGTYRYQESTVTIPDGLALVEVEQYVTEGCDQPSCRPDQECEERCQITGEYIRLEFESGCAFELDLWYGASALDQKECAGLDDVLAQVAEAHGFEWPIRAPTKAERAACEARSKGTEYDAEGNATGYNHCTYIRNECICVHGEATPPPLKD